MSAFCSSIYTILGLRFICNTPYIAPESIGIANKLGRNDLCHCGSGKKYKRCHLVRDQTASLRTDSPAASRPSLEEIQRLVSQHEAAEATRRRVQGEGKPILSAEFQGHRVVAAGNAVYFSPLERTQTFVDFLGNYIRTVIGIPGTFDGELPEFARGEAERMVIGNEYAFDDGTKGILRNGFVFEDSWTVVLS